MIKDIIVNLGLGAKDPAGDFAVAVGEAFEAHVAGIAVSYEPIIPGAVMGGIPPEFIEAQRNEADKKAKDAQISQGAGNLASAQTNLQRAQEDLAKRTDEANKLRTDAQTAQGAERTANEALTKAKDDIRDRDNKIAELEKEKTTLTAKVEALEIVKTIA